TKATLTSVTVAGTDGQGKGVVMQGREMEISGGEIKNVELGVLMMGAGTLVMTGVQISDVAMGVLMTGTGTLTVKNGEIGFKGGKENYGIGVGESVESATLDGVTIMGDGSGMGTGVIMGGREMTMTGVQISNVAMGVWVKGGTLTISGGTMTGVQTGITMSGSGTLTVNN
ncbi:hypothetical protein, partial [Bartonella bovis]|uniref:hypothetical protein n=1 Tax=Bartonella bovis TaxID=155194 RepID=UPI00195B0728